MAEKLLEIKNLSKHYGKGDSLVKALDDVFLTDTIPVFQTLEEAIEFIESNNMMF